MAINGEFRIYNAEGLGRAIRHFRQESGMTQEELAALVGTDQGYVSKLESGRGITEQTERLVDLLKALGVRIIVGKADW